MRAKAIQWRLMKALNSQLEALKADLEAFSEGNQTSLA